MNKTIEQIPSRFLFAWLLALSLAPTQAAAADRLRVVLLSLTRCCPEEVFREAEEKTRAELNALGLEVTLALPGEEEQKLGPKRRLREAAEASAAVCAVQIYRSAGKVQGAFDLWVAGPAPTGPRFFQVALDQAISGNPASLLALRVVEAVRANLLHQGEERLSPARPRGREGQGAGVGVGASALWSPGGAESRTGLELSADFAVTPALRLELQSMLSLWGRGFPRGATRTSLDLAALRGYGFLEFLTTSRIRPALGIGAGALLSWSAVSDAQNPDPPLSRAAAAYAGVSLRLAWFPFASRIWVRPELRLGWSIPKLRLIVGQQVLATLGAPLLEGVCQAGARF